MHYAHACTTAWANNAHTETHTDAFEPWPMSSTNVDEHLPCFVSSSISTRSLFWNPNMMIYFDYLYQHHWLSQYDFFFAGWLISTRSFPTWRSTCPVTHDDVNTVCWQQSCIQPFLCSHFCVNRTAHSTVVGTQQGTRVPRHLQHAQLVKQLHLELQDSCEFGNSWRWDPTTSHLYASTSHSVRWHSTTGILARGSKDQNQDGPQQVASSPRRRTTIPIFWFEDTREVEGILSTGNMADGAVNRWAPPTALRWSEQVSWANRHGRQHGRERRRVINNDHNRDGAQTTSRCRSTKTTEPCATWRSTHESLKCA